MIKNSQKYISLTPYGKRRLGLQSVMIMVVITALILTTFSVFATATPGGGHPVEVGPVSAEHGFPVWYKDANGTRLELCLDGGLNPLCGYTPDSFDATQPVTVPGNFPSDGEAFYMLGNANMETAGGGDAILVLAIEAAFSTDIVPGDQITFGRVRIWIDNLIDGGQYKVTHPYGYDLFTADTGPGGDGRRSIRWVEDIGIGSPGDFTGVLNSRIGPFLKWDPAVAPAAPAGYIGDIGVLHPVIGSPFNTNFFRVEGPVGSFTGSPNLCADPALGDDPIATDDCIQVDDFSLMGKYATNAGVDANRATYTQSSADGGKLDVFASSEPGQAIQIVKGAGYGTTLMGSNGLGSYFARIDFTGVAPAQLHIANVSDVPAATKAIQITDKVTIEKAEFDAELGVLTITAISSDTYNEPLLTAIGFGPLEVNGTLIVNGISVVPEKVTVTSAKGGSDSALIDVGGDVSFAPIPLTAGITVPDGEVIAPIAPDTTLAFNIQQSHTIILDGTSSTGDVDSYVWTQVAGAPVTLTGANTATASFTSASTVESVEFQLTVTRNNPLATDTKNVTINTMDIVAPTANAGLDQNTVLTGSTATLDGSASTNVATYNWTQIVNTGDPVVTLTGANTAKPTFVFPKYSGALTFQLTVSNAGGSATDEVQVRAVVDTLTTTRVQFTRSKNDWRIDGTASILGIPAGPGNEVRVYLGNYATEAEAIASGKLVGVSAVDATGLWSIRATNVPSNIRAAAGNTTITIFSLRGGRITATTTIK